MAVNPKVQSREAVNTTTASSHALAYSSNVTAGSTLFAWIRIASNSITVTGITDSLGNTWSLVRRQAHGTAADCGELWKCENCLGGANTITVSYSTATPSQFWISEYNGSQTVVEDQKTGANINNTSPSSGGTINTVHADSVVLLLSAFATGFSITADPAGYTRQDGASANRIAVFGKIVSTTLSGESPSFTTSTGEDVCCVLTNFGYTASGGLLHTQLERDVRGLDRGLCRGMVS